ncbi:MAG: hypothetical protein M0P57_03305 [Syntrophales bacterium]|jgi:hypothetical protein|nr:hypothetical protein [Syntrophales bacterium]MDY0043656.1 hypothetical protein [Syntrophales bacterium]
MKRGCIILLLFISLALAGCESRAGSAGLGALGGAAAGAGGYEWKINQELNRIEEARERGAMSQEEYNIRKDQIQRMSVLK